MAEREIVREKRKALILDILEEGTQFTNQIAREVGVNWPMADKLLSEMVQARTIVGDKLNGYRLPPSPTFWQRIKNWFIRENV
jgi:predicted transcriptional regulator